MEDKQAGSKPAKFRSRQVDALFQQAGYSGNDIYYSSIKTWFIWAPLSLVFVSFFAIDFFPSASAFFDFAISHWLFLLSYFVITYVFSAFVNNNFALTCRDLMIANPNFPFRRQMSIPYEDIEAVKIDRLKAPLILFFIIGSFGRNYIEIRTSAITRRFYCFNLPQYYDYGPDSGIKTIDEIAMALQHQGIAVTFNDNVD